MKLTSFTHLCVWGLLLALIAAPGCRKRPEGVTNIPPGRTLNPQDMPPGAPIADTNKPSTEISGIPQVDPSQFSNYVANAEIFKSDTVYFDFDSSVVKAAEKSKVASVAEHMKANPADALRVEGHCDERGTEEYNRALGERRALALRENLVGLGVRADHILTVTFGKDRPADPGHDEAAWSKNRRGEFILLTPPK